ncbi:MAG: serpin family protein [Clostridiales bacterium]|nr:serpin family protein [Candidatus Cacconaster stercorequi]
MKKRMVSLLLAVCMLLSLTACGNAPQSTAVNLAAGYTARQAAVLTADLHQGSVAASDFAVALMRSECGEDSVLLSPVSVLYALALTVNGAKGDTLAQMEATLGMTREELNAFLSEYLKHLPAEENSALHLANSLWLRDEADHLHVEPDFLQTCVNYYNAEIFSAPFDSSTVKEINGWTKEHTDGMIEKLLDEIPVEAVAYLVNALSFDGKWETPYEEDQVRDGTFHGAKGDTDCQMMHSTERVYLQGDHATGFMKYYDGYAFVALLPEEGMSVSDFVASLDGAKLRSILENSTYSPVETALPKFTGECSFDLAQTLSDLGITDLFDGEKADLSGLGTSEMGNLSVSRVIHKTFIDVNEAGTRAAAVTAVETKDSAAVPIMEEPPRVILDRPFVYMIVDTGNLLPLFMGTVTDM